MSNILKGVFTIRRTPKDAFVLNVEKDNISVPTYSNGQKKDYEPISFGFNVMYGSKDVTSECEITTYTIGDTQKLVRIVQNDNTITLVFATTNWQKDTKITLSIDAEHPQYGTVSKSLTIAPTFDGEQGTNAISLHLNTNTMVIPTMDGNISQGAVGRVIIGTIMSGGEPLTTNFVSYSPQTIDGVTVSPLANGVRITPQSGVSWTQDKSLTIKFSANVDGVVRQLSSMISIVGSAQGQTVQGAQGASIRSIQEYYRRTNTQVPPLIVGEESQWTDKHLEPTYNEQYVWNYERVEIYDPATDTTSYQTTDAHLCCSFADGLTQHTTLYLVTNTNVTPKATDNWLPLNEAMAQFSDTNRYFWNKEVWEYKDLNKNMTNIRLVAVWGERGTDASNIKIGVTAHDGTSAQIDKEYISINGKKIERFTRYRYQYAESGAVEKVRETNQLVLSLRGTHIFYINSVDLSLVEYDYADTYKTPEFSAMMFHTAKWYKDNYEDNIIVVVMTADAASFNQQARTMAMEFGAKAEGVYEKQRVRHFFVGCTKDMTVGQGYEEISTDPSLKEVAIPVIEGAGIPVNGGKGDTGTNGYNGAKPWFAKWSELKANPTIVYQGIEREEFYTIVYDDIDNNGWYIPKKTHTVASGERLTDDSLWRGSNMEFVATSVFFAQMAYVNNLGVSNVLITNGQEIQGGFCAKDDDGKGGTLGLGDVRLWLGGSNPQTAPNRQYTDGSVSFANGNFVCDATGGVTSKHAHFSNAIIDGNSTFYGYNRKAKKIINKDNIRDHVVLQRLSATRSEYRIVANKLGAWVDFQELPETIDGFRLKRLISFPSARIEEEYEDALLAKSLLGTSILIENHTGESIGLSGYFSDKDTPESFVSFGLNNLSYCFFECKLCKIDNQVKQGVFVYFKYTKYN